MRRATSVGLCLSAALAALLIGSCTDAPTEPAKTAVAPAHMPIALAVASTPSGATFTTDKDDYSPGDTLRLEGSGWQPGDSLDIHLDENPQNHPPLDWAVGVGDNGTFQDSTYIVQDIDIGVTFALTATSRATGEAATAAFTDGNIRAASAPAGVQFVLSRRTYTGAACTGTETSLADVTVGNAPFSTVATAGGTGQPVSVKLMAAATSTLGAPFSAWSSSSAFTIVGGDPKVICVAGGSGNFDYLATYTAVPDLTISKAPSGSFSVGSAGTYTITVSNSGSASALGTSGLTVKDTLAAGLTFSSGGGGASGWQACSASGQIVTCNLANGQSIAPSASKPFDVVVNVALAACPSVTNRAWVSGGGEPAANDGNNGTGNVVTTIATGCPAANGEPVVNPGGPYNGNEGSAIALDQATATDPNPGDVLLYTWSSSSPNCTFSATNVLQPTISCTDNGSYTATLSVDDQHGHVVARDATVNVSNVAPTATGLSTNSPVSEGSNIVFSLTGTSDVSTVDVTSLRYAFDCGDGSGFTAGTYAAASATNSATCSTNDNGTRTVKGKVFDKDGGVSTEQSALVTIDNVAPTATGLTTNSPVDEGSDIVFSVAGASDVSSVDAGSLRYAFDCGDGSGFSAGTYAAASATNSATCSTNDNGARTVKGKVFDKDGGVSTVQSSLVTINNVAPSATGLTTNSPVNEGSDIVFSLAGVSDPSTVDAASLHYAFDCGDGSGFNAGTYAAAGSTNSASCPTTDNGTRTVKGKVFDKDGGVSTEQSSSVTIQNVAPSITSVTTNPASPLTLGVGNQVSTTVTVAFTDPATTHDQPYATAIDCGNGTSTTGSPTTYGSSSGTCTYTAADVGFRTISAKVTDKDGGESTAGTKVIQIIFNFTGFFQPVDNNNLNVAKAGSAIPVKFNLGGNQGLNIFWVGDPKAYPNSSQVNCEAITEDQDTIEETVNAGNSSLTYDVTAQQYIYVWKTDKAWATKCRRLDVKLSDGTTHSAYFKFKN
jgi:uncharacterized repeat protein (TIGR01451 family)